MPKVGKKKTTKASQKVQRTSFVSKNPFRFMESYTSLLMGIIVVIIAVLFVVSFAKQTKHTQQTSSIATSAPQPTGITQTLPGVNKQKEYTVQAGDDLWHIAEKYYKSGYNWVDIASANNIANPDTIFNGDKLIIPDVASKAPTVESAPVANAITGNSYTVVKGDDLWRIAVRAYGDGFRWVDIAKANQLADPSIIHSGNILKIPH